MRKDVNGDLEQNSNFLTSSIIVIVICALVAELTQKITQENELGNSTANLITAS